MSAIIPNQNTTKYTSTFLDTPDLIRFSSVSKTYQSIFKEELDVRAHVSKELLTHVFNAVPVQVRKFFERSVINKKWVLKKTAFKEGYHCERLKGYVCFRQYRHISAIQAAARCGDNFLLVDLLSHIEDDIELREEAARQLQEVLDQIEMVIPKTDMALGKGDRKSSAEKRFQVKEERKLQTEKERKSQKETDGNSMQENYTKFAEKTEYLAPFNALIKAYQNFITEYRILVNKRQWTKIEKLWQIVGECQKRLSRYGLQEYFAPKPFHALQDFSAEPFRGSLLNLDNLALGELGLHKGPDGGVRLDECTMDVVCIFGVPIFANAQSDLAAIMRLCEILRAQLVNIIARLREGGPITLESKDKEMPSKP